MNQDSQTCSCSLHVTIATLLLPAAPIAALGSWRSDWALWGGFPKKIGNVQELPAWCARSILTIIKDACAQRGPKMFSIIVSFKDILY